MEKLEKYIRMEKGTSASEQIEASLMGVGKLKGQKEPPYADYGRLKKKQVREYDVIR